MALLRKAFGEYLFIGLVLLLGIAASVWLGWRQNIETRDNVLENFSSVAQDRIRVVESATQNALFTLHSLAAFFEASQEVDANEFSLYAERIIRDYPYILALEWAPLINEQDKAAFLKRANQQFPGYSLRDLGEDGALIPSQAHKNYFPVYYITASSPKNENLRGFNLLSEPQRAEAINTARETHQITATGRISILQTEDEDEKSGFLLFAPVYERQKSPTGSESGYERLRGYVAALIPVSKLVQLSIKPLSPAGVNVVVHDIASDGGSEQFLDVHSSRIKRMDDLQVLRDYERPDILRQTETFDVAGRKWRVTVLASSGFFSLGIENSTWVILGSGVLVSLLIATFMIQRIRENERISQEVAERTQELGATKRQVELILRSSHDGIVGLDAEGKITFCNPMGISLLGYTRRELLGQTHHALFHHSTADGKPLPLEACPIQQTLETGNPCTVSDEVFWTKDNRPIPVEYAVAPMIEDEDINGAVVVFRDITERKQNESKLEQLARYDILTGVANRTLFVELLKKAMPRAARESKKLAVIYMDLNGFKPVNDSLGHAAGDMVLKEFARRITTALREHDTLARMGGDEFTILATDLVTRDGYQRILERCNAALEPAFVIDGHSFKISASSGVAVFPDDASDLDDLISKADAAMYETKRASKEQGNKKSKK